MVLLSFFKKRAHPRPLFHLISFFKQTLQFLQQIYVKTVHPVYGAGIGTHNLLYMSLLPYGVIKSYLIGTKMTLNVSFCKCHLQIIFQKHKQTELGNVCSKCCWLGFLLLVSAKCCKKSLKYVFSLNADYYTDVFKKTKQM